MAELLSREDLEVELGGRRLLAEVVGPRDGPLVVFHSGTPDSRHLFEGHLRAAVERGLRHVCYSRPGYEGSDRHPGRSVADAAAETAALADALGAERFHVFGISGGGSPALACAALIPERVTTTTVFASVAPRDAEGLDWLAGFPEASVAEYLALERGDEELQRSIELSMAEMTAGDGGIEAAFGDCLCAADLAATTGLYGDYQSSALARLAAGGIWGWFDDDKAHLADWGFDLAQVQGPVALWHGRDDLIVPISHGEWLAKRIPGIEPRWLANEGHISLMANRYEEVLDRIVAAEPGGNICSPA